MVQSNLNTCNLDEYVFRFNRRKSALLRFVVFASSVYVALMAYEEQKEKWVWISGFLAVLFNLYIRYSSQPRKATFLQIKHQAIYDIIVIISPDVDLPT